MAEAAIRIALLARAGKAREQLHRALDDAGANIVVEGDPAELDPAQVAGQAPTVFLVSLEPALETALDRFDELLSAPDVEVMFDDGEVTGKLDGWDLNRWARHLASKLLGSGALPPVPENLRAEYDHIAIAPGAPPTPAELMDGARLEDYTTDTSELADSVPVSPSLTSSEAGEFDLSAADLDATGLDFPELPGADASAATQAALGPPSSYGELDLDESVSFSSFGQDAEEPTLGDLDADVAELAAQLEAFEQNDQRFPVDEPVARATAMPAREARMISESIESVAVAEAAPAPAPRAEVSFDFSNLALAPIEAEGAVAVAPVAATATAPAAESGDSQGLSLTGRDGHEGLGAVVILAGLGGPDAVRQLLSSLPDSLAVPVLLYQHLEVGKHERLVEQLAKISRLPVELAQAGATPAPGRVTLLPAGMTAQAKGASLAFAPGPLDLLIAALPPLESVIIVLSGAEPQLVPQILAVRDAGGLVLAQDPEVCFDASAAEAMQRQGAAVYPALGLARQIAARWPA
jgi:chemotaxis response regulator CheB